MRPCLPMNPAFRSARPEGTEPARQAVTGGLTSVSVSKSNKIAVFHVHCGDAKSNQLVRPAVEFSQTPTRSRSSCGYRHISTSEM